MRCSSLIKEIIPYRKDKIKGYLYKKLRETYESVLNLYDDSNIPHAIEHYFKKEGKYLRPLIYSFVCDEIGEAYDVLPHLSNAASLEMLHVSTLVHDDIVDNADKRRGIDSINKQYGNNVAIFVGDILVSHAIEISSFSPIIANLYRIISQGQLLEEEVKNKMLRGEKVNNLDEIYKQIIYSKTAKFFEVSYFLPLLINKIFDKKKDLLTMIGRNIGIAYQMFDDLTDFEKDNMQDYASDLKESKPTILYVKAKNKDVDIIEIYKEHIWDLLDNGETYDDAHIKAALNIENILKEYDIFSSVMKEINIYLDNAGKYITKLENPFTRQFSEYLISYIRKRMKNFCD